MKKQLHFILSLCIISATFATSFVNDFLRMDTDIRSSSMGGCPFASRGASAIFNNPAAIGSGDFLFFGHEQLYDGLLISDAAGIEINIGGPGDFALGALYVGGSGIKTTELPDPGAPVSASNRPLETGEESHHDIALVPGYAVQCGDNLRFGASGGLIFRDLVESTGYGALASLGADWTPLQDFHLGVVLSNASYTTWSSGSSEFGAPSMFLGSSYGMPIAAGINAELCAGGCYSLQEGLIEGSAGLEISYKDLFAVRGGISDNDFSAGADLCIFKGFRAGAALSVHKDLPVSYRIGLSMSRGGEISPESSE